MTREHEWLAGRLDKIEEKLDAVRLEVAGLKVKAAAGGALAGMVLAALISFLFKFKGL